MSELRQFKLPDVGEGLTEAEIVKWHVQPGDKVSINQIIVEIETAKAAVEPGIHGSPAPKQERQAVLVGYGVKLGASKRRARKPTGPAPANTVLARAGASATGGGDATAGGTAGGAATGGDATAGGTAKAIGGPTAVLAKPPVRKLAKELGVDLAGLTGSGPAGSITRDDIQAAARAPGAGAPAEAAEPTGPGQATAIRLASLPREERIPIRG